MNDQYDENGMRPGIYDDDRLLACALGLEDDHELLEAAAADPELADRIATMRADVAAIGARVSAAVPEPDETYTDLSGERWIGLTQFFEPPAPARRRRQRRRWRVLAPVAALAVLALVVGIVAIDGGGSTGTSRKASEAAPLAADDAMGSASGKSFTESGFQQPILRISEAFSHELDRFAVVVLARARQATGAVQRFAVLRTFKGKAPKVVELVVNDHPTDPGRLHLLLLDPTTTAQGLTPIPGASSAAGAAPSATESPSPFEGSPIPAPTTSLADAGPGQELAVAYTYQGEPTVVREFAAGTDPSSVSISIP